MSARKEDFGIEEEAGSGKKTPRTPTARFATLVIVGVLLAAAFFGGRASARVGVFGSLERAVAGVAVTVGDFADRLGRALGGVWDEAIGTKKGTVALEIPLTELRRGELPGTEVVASPSSPAPNGGVRGSVVGAAVHGEWRGSRGETTAPADGNGALAGEGNTVGTLEAAPSPVGNVFKEGTGKVAGDVAPPPALLASEPLSCTFAGSSARSPMSGRIVLNEVAWMGTRKSGSDEWIELASRTGEAVAIEGWQLIDQSDQIHVVFERDAVVAAGGFFLLERTDDDSVPSVVANIIYKGALSNADEGLRLFDDRCRLVDEVLADHAWPAGNNAAKTTLERTATGGWQTSAARGGTPKAPNSTLVELPEPSPQEGGGAPAPPLADTPPSGGNSSPGGADGGDAGTTPAKLLISEIQITGGSGKTKHDFIEIYNPNGFDVNLKGYRLVKRTKTGTSDGGIKSWTSDAIVPAGGYYLWANSSYADIPVAPDVTTSAIVSADNGVAIRFGPADTGEVVDSVGWGAAQNAFVEGQPFGTNPGANESIERKVQGNGFLDSDANAGDFELRTGLSPKAQSTLCR